MLAADYIKQNLIVVLMGWSSLSSTGGIFNVLMVTMKLIVSFSQVLIFVYNVRPFRYDTSFFLQCIVDLQYIIVILFSSV